MYTANIKKSTALLLALAIVLMNGCHINADSPQSENSVISSVQSTESTYDSSTVSDDFQTERSDISSEQSEDSSDFSSEEEPPQPEFPFYAGRVYPDDELVPSEWIRVDSIAEVMEKVDEIIKSDTSVRAPEIALPALMNKNVLFYLMFFSIRSLLDINWDPPYNSLDFEKTIYPFTTEYFPDVQSIYDFAYQPYERSYVEEHFLFGTVDSPKKPFVEENGQMYINTNSFPAGFGGGPGSFLARSYVEITEKTDNKCTFIWHYPDVEMLNLPEDGYEFHYYEKTYTAEYVEGSWKLNKIILNTG